MDYYSVDMKYLYQHKYFESIPTKSLASTSHNVIGGSSVPGFPYHVIIYLNNYWSKKYRSTQQSCRI